MKEYIKKYDEVENRLKKYHKQKVYIYGTFRKKEDERLPDQFGTIEKIIEVSNFK